MNRGNFSINDSIAERLSLDCFAMDDGHLRLWSSAAKDCAISVKTTDGLLQFSAEDPAFNRIWITCQIDSDETIWGGGEQMSYLALNGRHFPFWTSEPGVGRDKTTELTQTMDAAGNAGGDYWTTNYPQPTWLSSKRYAAHLATNAYSAFDLRVSGELQIESWSCDFALELFSAASLADLVSKLSNRFGRQPQLPDWAITGAIVGLKDGPDSFARLDAILASGASISGLWCEDWVGIRQTDFGKRLFWDWQWNPARYPELPAQIATLHAQGIRFLGYVNPYLAVDGALYQEAANLGLLALRLNDDEIYAVDFGQFDAAVVDFTNPEACKWFSERVLQQELLDFGISGWMADFGEYLPTDVRLHDGSDPMEAHNRWPVLWAKVNAQAIANAGKTGEAVFFMRAGFSGVQEHCPLLWAGDQCVDFSRHDGIGTVITAALSAGLVGNAYHHSDLGGYTSLHGVVRTADLLHRWIDLAAFAPVMRSHEGNRPADNLQIDSSPELLNHFARMTQIHARLAPYVRGLSREAETSGLPLQRPLFLHYEVAEFMTIQDQFLYGEDLLVAPVIDANVQSREVILPNDDWVHLWSGASFNGGRYTINAPYGEPPVFYRTKSVHAVFFAEFAK
jgi:alpha-glucosidase